MEEIASPKYEHCWYNNLTYEHSGFRFQVCCYVQTPWHLPQCMSERCRVHVQPIADRLHAVSILTQT